MFAPVSTQNPQPALKARKVISSPSRFLGLMILIGSTRAEFLTIRNPGNTADPSTGFGAVKYSYQISKYEVTTLQWGLFYHDPNSGKVGTFADVESYSRWIGFGYQGVDAPVVNVSIHHAAQYCNWLTTGSATLGAYSIDDTGAVTSIDRSYRNVEGNLFVLPTENEWFKAAYSTGNSENSWSLYAHGMDTEPSAGLLHWQYWNLGYMPLKARSPYDGSAEQNGTLNMMGNVSEWVEWTLSGNGRARGGYFQSGPSALQSTYHASFSPNTTNDTIGFRVVAIPEPCTALLSGLACVILLNSLILRRWGIECRRRVRSGRPTWRAASR